MLFFIYFYSISFYPKFLDLLSPFFFIVYSLFVVPLLLFISFVSVFAFIKFLESFPMFRYFHFKYFLPLFILFYHFLIPIFPDPSFCLPIFLHCAWHLNRYLAEVISCMSYRFLISLRSQRASFGVQASKF